MKVEKWQISVALVCIILGVLIAVQFQTQKSISEAVPTRRVEELANMLKSAKDSQKFLDQEESSLKKQLSQAAFDDQDDNKIIEEEVKKINILAGLTEVAGPGVIVTLDDSQKAPKAGEDPNLYIIHNEDILKVVNELWAAGAEVMAVNGQRLTATSEITCAGPTISINQTRLAPPYVITAIGNPNTLDAAFHLRGGIFEALGYFAKQYGIQVKVEKKDQVILPPYKGSENLKYAKPAKAGV